MGVHIYKKSFKAVVLIAAILSGLSVFGSPNASAAASIYTDHPIDDAIMRSQNTMSPDSIQAFLQSKNSGLTNFYDIEDCGSSAGSHYRFYASYYSCGSAVRASKIIYDAAQAYGINPQAIIATMQKEQSLITTPNPDSSQLNYAMGYGCPDSGGCSYAGFFNQVDNGTWQLRVDMELSSGNNYWGYTPASYPCNGATRFYSAALKAGNYVGFIDGYGTTYTGFTIPNAATAALYCYTPHVYPGSAKQYYSGSYNFVDSFNKWFGSTLVASYAWQYAGQTAFSDSSKSTVLNPTHVQAGQRIYMQLKAKNIGNSTWSKYAPNPIRLATDEPRDRSSILCDPSWISCSRAAGLVEPSVAPGATGTFEFWVTAPHDVGAYYERFNLLVEGLTWLNSVGLIYTVGVDPTYTWDYAGQAAYYDSGKTQAADVSDVPTNQRLYLTLNAKNTGNSTWSNTGPNPIEIGTNSPRDRSSAFKDSTWLKPNRVALLNESSVAPGQTGTFGFWVTTPSNPGNYREYFNLLAENASWMDEHGQNYNFGVHKPSYTWDYVGQAAYTDSTATTPVDISNLSKNQRFYVTLSARNSGNTIWSPYSTTPVEIGTNIARDRSSVFKDSTWIKANRPALLKESSVGPGQVGNFGFWMTAPSTAGTYKEYFNLLAENASWMDEHGQNYTLTVR